MDLPQPRRPPEGYVEMSFKSRPSLEQEYINMNMGSAGSAGSGSTGSTRTTRTRRQNPGSRIEKSQRSKPIAIQMSSKTMKIPSFLPLNGSPMSESLASTPVSPPRATPTGSNATIFPFSLNSPQSPIKPFKAAASITAINQEDNGPIGSTATLTTCSAGPMACDYAIMTPGIPSTSGTSSSSTTSPQISISQPSHDEITRLSSSSSVNTLHEVPQSPLTERLAELTLSRTKTNRNSGHSATTVSPKEPETNSTDKTPVNPIDNIISCFRLSNQSNDLSHSPVTKRRGDEIVFSKMKTSRASYPKDETNLPSTSSSHTSKTSLVNNCDANNAPQGASASTATTTTTATCLGQNPQAEMPTSPLTKRLCELSVAKAKLVQPSPNTSPTPSAGFKIIQTTPKSLSSATLLTDEDQSGGTTPTTTPTPTPSPLDSEGYEKLQPGATILHYASLDLPEVGGPPPPLSPTPVIEAFNYAEIDFAKLKQN